MFLHPIEIVKEGNTAIQNYYDQLQAQEEDYLFEAKLLILGEPGAGKTSMAWKIEDPQCRMPEEKDTTKGIDIRQYHFPIPTIDFPMIKADQLNNRQFQINLWDFGGQEIYKATHRFFLSQRSIYALVGDSRNEDTDFNYWLHLVELFGGDSPFLIVLNEKHGRKRNLDIEAMRRRFSNITQVIDVDFAESDKSRLEKLRRVLRECAKNLPHIGSPVPARWREVREALLEETRQTIPLQDYLMICQAKGIEKLEDVLTLSQYFHDIGVFLHFQKDPLLKKTLFLKPNWATKAIYKILDHPLLNQQKGRFSRKDVHSIWPEAEYMLLHDEFLRLMQKFFLIYEIDNTGVYIAPDKLDSIQPSYPFDQQDVLQLRFKYDYFMPKGLMAQFIVDMHRFIA